MDTSPSVEGPNSVGGGNVWFNGADGERQAIRVDSRDTHGAYSVIESVAEPGCAVPTHRPSGACGGWSRPVRVTNDG
jgi:hypothetical protein